MTIKAPAVLPLVKDTCMQVCNLARSAIVATHRRIRIFYALDSATRHAPVIQMNDVVTVGKITYIMFHVS